MRIAIDPSLSFDIGFGHFRRCCAIAKGLAQLSHQVDFVIRDPAFDWLLRGNYNILRSIGSDSKYNVIIVDRYDIDEYILENYKKLCNKLVRIDDASPFVIKDKISDVIINGNPYAEEVLYKNQVRKDCLLMLGSDFIPMDKGFCKVRKRYRIRKSIKKMLISFGGSNVGLDYVTRICEALFTNKVRYEILIPNASPNNFPKMTDNIKSLPFTDNFSDVVFDSDIAICSSSSICWQLATVGVPFLTIPIADNQDKVFEYVKKKKIGIALEPRSIKNGQLIKALDTLQFQIRQQYWSRSRKIICCGGAERIGRQIDRIISN